jgi:hypothetical protein
MEKQIISRRIAEILEEITRLGGVLRSLEATDPRAQAENYMQLSLDAALRSESIACRLRHISYAGTPIKKPDYLNDAADVHGIQIEQRDGVVEITLPSLLSKRKRQRGTEFLLDPLNFALSEYADTHRLTRFRDCVVCFSHVYARELPTRRIRDYDNLELKQILDVIAGFIMTDDTGLLCDAYNTTELGDADCTRMSVMDKSHFTNWLRERENLLESIADF